MAKRKKKASDREVNPTDKVDETGLDPTTEPGYFDAPNPAEDAAVTTDFQGVSKLTKDLTAAARLISRREARYLLDAYYQIQNDRKAQFNRKRAGESFREPVAVLTWFAENSERIEADLKLALGEFAKQYRVGNWLQSIRGIGPILSAGIIAQLDVPPPVTVGKWYRFAGLDPTVKWLGTKLADAMVKEIAGTAKKLNDTHREQIAAQLHMDFGHFRDRLRKEEVNPESIKEVSAFAAKRPWNARLKRMMAFAAGDSFVKTMNKPDGVYGKLYAQRKEYETAKNLNGDYRDIAAGCLTKLKDKSKPAYKANAEGYLALGHIHNRCRRWAVKIFLSHVHEIFYRDYYDAAPPVPFIFNKAPDVHTHYIPPPNISGPEWAAAFPGKSLKEMTGLELTERIKPLENEEEGDAAE